jgi:hypothetical protein
MKEEVPQKSYWCLWCMKELKGEYMGDGAYRFTHDQTPHPENYAYDEDDHPQ